MTKRSSESRRNHEFDEQWENELLLTTNYQENRFALFVKVLFHVIEDMILKDTIKNRTRLT